MTLMQNRLNMISRVKCTKYRNIATQSCILSLYDYSYDFWETETDKLEPDIELVDNTLSFFCFYFETLK